VNLLPKKQTQIAPAVLAAQDFVNVRDICNSKLYTKDGFVYMYLKVTPVSIDLKTESEKRALARQLAAEFGSEREPFKIIAVSRPLDLSTIIDELNEYSKNADEAERKEAIRLEKRDINRYMLDGNAVTRQFFFCIWSKDDNREITRRISEWQERFNNCRINAEILSDEEIVRLCHVMTNPEEIGSDKSDFAATVPLVGSDESEQN
jgi:hypothetical protein